MSKYFAIAAVVSAAAVLAGCQSDVQRKEDRMAAAGFQVRVATTPAMVAELSKLPPQKFMLATMKNGKNVYFYADPAGCNCVYYGGDVAYRNYQGLTQAQAIADKQLMAATMMDDASWNWGAWGPGWGPYGGFY